MRTNAQLRADPEVKSRVRDLKSRMTLAERAFERICKSLRLPIQSQVPFVLEDERYRIADFHLGSPWNYVVEIDGGYHVDKRVHKYDLWKDRSLRNVAKTNMPIRFKNEEVFRPDFPQKLMAFLMEERVRRQKNIRKWMGWDRKKRKGKLMFGKGYKFSELRAMGIL